ncbi:MAG: NADH-quinone oxidoreductase subunit L [Cyclobacteriaceae bacterium]|nr:MAG: NADH-quinone oxidoreductase subunit L [Cyclobacteriaceae bacterium]
MTESIWIIIALPLVSFLILAFVGQRMTRQTIALVATAGTGIAALFTLVTGWRLLSSNQANFEISSNLWEWINTSGLTIHMALHLDALALVFIFVITFVGFLILVYSTEFMNEDSGYARFFAYINLFIASMLILVLADNLLLLYLGWEGVGLCSYLLIGFWYQDPSNGYAARKAFIMTRIGDTALIIGLFLLFVEFGTLNIGEILTAAPEKWVTGDTTAKLAAFLLLGGAVGKSAQLPLQTWLPDAMAGPSPVSALIHAATMVTAGVYLIARTHAIFELAPEVQFIVAIVGAITLLIAGFSALVQRDIKRVLAYSTMSQIGYMFLALGVGAWSAAIFHFMIHAFFKALLFLGAGAIIMVLHHEHDMFKMGGLYKKLPVIFWTFLIASASLAALPLVTAGFYSKDLILWQVFASNIGGSGLWAMGFAGAFITALYSSRMVLVTFFGKTGISPTHRPGWAITTPLLVLAFLSFAGGFIELPHTMGHTQLFSEMLHGTLPALTMRELPANGELMLQIITGLTSIIAVGLACLVYLRRPSIVNQLKSSSFGNLFVRLWFTGWGFDVMYNALIVRPLVSISKLNKKDILDNISIGVSRLMAFGNSQLVLSQSGKLRWYMMIIALGAILTLTLSIVI